MSVDYCTCTHRARLKCYINFTVPQSPTAKLLTGIVYCVGFGMKKSVLTLFTAISSCGDYFIVSDNYRTDGNFVFRSGNLSLFNSLLHIV